MAVRTPRFKAKAAGNGRYGYATGRIRALEARLIGSSRLERYFEAPSPDEIGRLLSEDGYLPASDPETSLDRERSETYQLIQSVSPDPQMIDTLLLAHDFHNLKVMLKAFAVYWPRRDAGSPDKMALELESLYEGGARLSADKLALADLETGPGRTGVWAAVHGNVTLEQLQPLFLQPSIVDPQKLYYAMIEEKLNVVPPFLQEAARAASLRYEKTYDVAEIDIELDKRLARLMTEAAAEIAVPFFSAFICLRIDLVNIGLLLRTRQLRGDEAYLGHILLPGGSIPADKLAACCGEPISRCLALLSQSDLSVLADAISGFASGGAAVARFSREADELLLRAVRPGRRVLRGPEVLLGYWVAKEMEIKTIRIILVCLRNHIPADKARELIRSAYLEI